MASRSVSLDVVVRSVTKDAGKGLDQASGMFDKFASGIGSTISSAATVATSALAGIASASLVKGFQRLSAIDDATAKLKGLGHSAGETKTIMDNALASVKGTAFGLGDAASQAASLVAAGIKPGAELTRSLKLVADTATIAGTSMGDMGAIFNKVAAGGKVTTEVLNQLTDRGVPALQLLATSMGKSVPEVQKLVSAGKVGFADFQKAMEQGLGGAALSSGATFKGALANVGAALSRIGAAFLGPAFGQGAAFFTNITNVLDKLVPIADKAGQVVGKAFAFIAEQFTKLTSGAGLGSLFDTLKQLAPVIAPLVGAFGALGSTNLAGLLGPLGKILPAINPILGAVIGLVAASPELQAALMGAFQAALPVIAQVGEVLGQVFAAVAPVIAEVVGALAPLIGALAGALLPVIQELLPVVMQMIPIWVEFALQISDTATQMMPLIVLLVQLAGVVLVGVAKGIQYLLPILSNFQATWLSAFVVVGNTAEWITSTAIPAVKAFATAVGSAMSTAAQWVSDAVGTIQRFIEGLIRGFQGVASSITSALSGVYEAITAPFKTAIKWVEDAISGLKRGWNGIASSINGVSITFGPAPDWVPGIGGQSYTFDPPNVPLLARGAWVTHPTLALVGEGRSSELVAPEPMLRRMLREESSSGSRHYSINVTVAAGVAPAEVGRQIVDQIRAFERAAGPGWRAA